LVNRNNILNLSKKTTTMNTEHDGVNVKIYYTESDSYSPSWYNGYMINVEDIVGAGIKSWCSQLGLVMQGGIVVWRLTIYAFKSIEAMDYYVRSVGESRIIDKYCLNNK
jgi:hypothetical protein